MQNSGILFDLDGTLLNTIADIARAMNRVLREHELPEHGVDDYRGMVGWGLEELVRRALPVEITSPAFVRQCFTEVLQAYEQEPVVDTRPYDGVPELLRRLHEAEVPLAVLSNKHDALVQTIVANAMRDSYFQIVRGASDGEPKKPNPKAALEIARCLDTVPEKLLVVGDSPIDVETARRAGMPVVVGTWGFSTREELEAAAPDALLDHPLQIMSHICSDTSSHRKVTEGTQ